MTLNCQVSWRFPARNPEPTPSNLSELSSVVKQLKLDVAFVHDGDADRLVLISPSGEILPHSVASILLLRSLELSSGTIVLSENTSNDVEDAAVEAGLKVVRTKIGKTFTELRNGAILSMEPSKAAYGRWGYWEDGIFAAVVIANILASSNSVLEKTVGNIRWNYTQLNIQGATDIEQLEPKVLESLNKYGVEEVRRVDGIKFVLRDGSWLMIRRSGTEPKLRIYCESRDKTILRKIVKLVASCVEGGK